VIKLPPNAMIRATDQQMKHPCIILSIAAAALFIYGCRSAVTSQPLTMNMAPLASREEELSCGVTQAVIQDLFTSCPDLHGVTPIGTIFLHVLDKGACVQDLLTNTNPRFDLRTENMLQTKGGLIDRTTKKRAMAFTVQTLYATNGVAQARGGWYFSPQGGSVFLYVLAFEGGKWVIKERKLKGLL
jgi:hypothetical protein